MWAASITAKRVDESTGAFVFTVQYTDGVKTITDEHKFYDLNDSTPVWQLIDQRLKGLNNIGSVANTIPVGPVGTYNPPAADTVFITALKKFRGIKELVDFGVIAKDDVRVVALLKILTDNFDWDDF